MSSSGEEVEVENVDEKVFHWSNEHVRKLVRYVQSRLGPQEDLAPYSAVKIDWDDVEDYVGVDSAKCEHKWKLLIASVRTYRTMPEIALEILAQNAKNDIAKYNKSLTSHIKFRTFGQQTIEGSLNSVKKKKVRRKANPDHPARPKVNGYSVFCSKMINEVKQNGLSGVPLMLKLAAMWKEVSEAKKAAYNAECLKQKEEYLLKVQEYAKNHPDDKEIQEILAEELAKVKSPNSHTAKKNKVEAVDVSQTTLDDTLSSVDSILSSPKKTQKKKRHADDSELSQDSGAGKKKKAKRWTAEDVYIDSKFESYKEEHPSLDDDEVRSKLTRKFNKMSEDKKAKYSRRAEERNT